MKGTMQVVLGTVLLVGFFSVGSAMKGFFHPVPIVRPPSKPINPGPNPPTTPCNLCEIAEAGFAAELQKFSEVQDILDDLIDEAGTCDPPGSVDVEIIRGSPAMCPAGSKTISCRCEDPGVCTGVKIGADGSSCSAFSALPVAQDEEVIAVCAYDFNNKFSILSPISAFDRIYTCPSPSKMINCYASSVLNGVEEVRIEGNTCTVIGGCTGTTGCDLFAVCKLD